MSAGVLHLHLCILIVLDQSQWQVLRAKTLAKEALDFPAQHIHLCSVPAQAMLQW